MGMHAGPHGQGIGRLGSWAHFSGWLFFLLSCSACSMLAWQKRFGGGMAAIPPGCFSMGKEGWEETEPVHRVCLDGFAIDRTEVTLAEYGKCVDRKGCQPPVYFPEPAVPAELRSHGLSTLELILPPPHNPEDYWDKASIPGKRDCPVVGITWMDAHQYCRDMGKRLPTEAEWEYALLGGDSVFRDTALELANPMGWFAENSKKKAWPVGRKSPNRLGIHDMLGNVGEYVQDRYSSRYYASSPDRNPQGPEAGEVMPGPDSGQSREMHVVRGGSWSSPFGPYLACWRWSDREPRSWWVGFRCARSL